MKRALDLFCCGGGATRGLQRAGYHVTGVDIVRSKHYIGDSFIEGSALEVDLDGYDFIWASPPCQAFTAYKRRPGHVKPKENLIPQVRERLQTVLCPWVIENVGGAPLNSPIMLCGSMFGLDVRRHRFFEASFPIPQPDCQHQNQAPRFPGATNRKNLRSTVEVGVYRIPLKVQQEAMGISWLPLSELSQAIPPAYAEYIARSATHDQTKKAEKTHRH